MSENACNIYLNFMSQIEIEALNGETHEGMAFREKEKEKHFIMVEG